MDHQFWIKISLSRETTAWSEAAPSCSLPDWQLSSANSIKIRMLEGYLWDIWHLHSALFHSSYIEHNEHFPIYVYGVFGGDLSGYATYFLAEVMVSIYLLPSTHQLINIVGVAYGQKYPRKPTQVHLKQPQSEQVNRHYNPAPRERLRPAILFTDCVPLMGMCWLRKRSVEEHEKFVKQATSCSMHHQLHRREQSKNVSHRRSAGD